ncbi:hypothetical protein ACFOTA_16800 [Chitinophaga sp. GCM10012297]|uniref:Uncharacterized protein n=1 Tax=Chitinophaga chungangae TaxID=2821488 RepID=A0ABS3YGS8_9BACT|nr:hypothetical protein [Chitinophaga chungangae]MBO9153881.1 hypothetical protein [Chitinophaga chungangae]
MKSRYLPLLCLLLTGCIKDHWPGTPDPEVPPFLISRMIAVQHSGTPDPLPGEHPERFFKEVNEFHYNAFFKPESRYSYVASGADTLALRLQVRDTLYYDTKHRVVQVDGYIPSQSGVRERKKFTYEGNDTLPATMQVWYSGMPEPDSLYFQGTTRFAYKTDTALMISVNAHGGLDTMFYIYAGGNFMRQYGTTGYEVDVYTTYDNATGIEHLIGLSHGLVFRLPVDNVKPPVLSRNNWTGEGLLTQVKTIAYLPGGNLVDSYTVTQNDQVPLTWKVRFEYFIPNP